MSQPDREDAALDDGGAVIGVGASAGGVEALRSLVRALPDGFRAPLLVVLHISPTGASALAQILDRSTRLSVVTAADGMRLRAGCIYVAPPDRHLLVADGVVQLSAGPREHGLRPAIDPLMRSLAALGTRAIGVILSGTLDDGTQGLVHLKAAGGTALVQTPDEAAYDGMVRSAIANVDVDEVLPVAAIATRLAHLTHTEMPAPSPPDPVPGDIRFVDTRYTCPECGGHISREHIGTLVRFRCEVGHAYSPHSLDGNQALAVEAALWAATRLLGDRATLLDEMAERAADQGHEHSARGFRDQAEEARRAGLAVRDLLEGGQVPTAGAHVAAT